MSFNSMRERNHHFCTDCAVNSKIPDCMLHNSTQTDLDAVCHEDIAEALGLFEGGHPWLKLL